MSSSLSCSFVDEIDLDVDEDFCDNEQLIRVYYTESGEMYRFFLKPQDKVSVLIENLKSKLNVKSIRLTKPVKLDGNIEQIDEDGTIGEIKLTGAEFLTASNTENRQTDLTKPGMNSIPLIIKCDTKKSYTYHLGKNTNFQPILNELSSLLKVPKEKIKLMFDGVKINISKDTPKDLEMDEEGNCLDVFIAK